MIEAREIGVHADTAIEIGTPVTCSVFSVALYAEDGKPVPLDSQTVWYGNIHATWGGRCVKVAAATFWPWAAALVGMAVTGDFRDAGIGLLLDFDHAERQDADRKYGLSIGGGKASDFESQRHVDLTLGETWDALCALEAHA